MTNWLLVFFLSFLFFAVLRLLRAPVLRGLTHNFYFNYIIVLFCVQILFFVVWFFYGNSVFFRSIRRDNCNVVYLNDA